MPIVRITITAGKTQEYRKAVLDGVHNALVQALRIPDTDRHQMLHELDADHFEVPPRNTANMTVVEITAFKGRSPDAKRNLYQSIVANLAKDPGIKGDDVLIILHEPPLENWGIRGGRPASEVNFGFKIDV